MAVDLGGIDVEGLERTLNCDGCHVKQSSEQDLNQIDRSLSQWMAERRAIREGSMQAWQSRETLQSPQNRNIRMCSKIEDGS
jgi:hypothetical protein